MTRFLVPSLAVIAALTAAPALAIQNSSQAEAARSEGTPSSASERLRNLYEAEWEWRREQDAQIRVGDRNVASDHFPRVDAATQAVRLAYWERVLAELDTIPVDQLSSEEQVNAAVFRTVIEEQAGDVRWRTYEIPFNSDSFFWTVAPWSTLDDAAAYERYIARIADIPRYFDEHIVNMRAGLARGFSIPQVSLAGRDETIVPYTSEGDDNPLWAPFRRMPDSIPAETQARLRAEGRAAINSHARPAYRELLAFIREEYIPNARTTLGATQMPDGEAFYQAMIRKFTTLDLSAREIHDIGLREVARIRAEMETVKANAGFDGSLAEFIHFLRTDPQFYAKTPDELLGYASYVVMRANGQLGETIGHLPRYRHGIIPVPDEIAPIYTSGRGGLQNCLFNTYNLPARPLYALPALALHECTPGHSFQAALALEGPDRPEFRQQTYFSGYGEGWGLYVEWLGTKMGIYRTPYEDFGRLSYEMWRAARLVIDTGIHAYGWSRDRALDYLRENTALSELEIVNEIDRYISWPGQALAYKLGELTIRRLRTEAETRLGDRFDQRKFHDVVLALGSVPLPVLENRVRAYIEEERDRPPEAS